MGAVWQEDHGRGLDVQSRHAGWIVRGSDASPPPFRSAGAAPNVTRPVLRDPPPPFPPMLLADVSLPTSWRRLRRVVATLAASTAVAAVLLAPAPARADRTASRTARASKAARRSGSATLRGSKAAVDNAYLRAKRDGLAFARSRREIERGARAGEYVALARSSSTYRLHGVTTPYVRPATRDFVASFGAAYARRCGEPMTVTSAMRPTSLHLANSVEKTVHPTGMAVDLRAPRSAGCRAWMRTSLLGLEAQGVVNATEEHRPAHFHVVVYRAP